MRGVVPVSVTPLRPADEPFAEGLVNAIIGSRQQARLGELHDVLALPGFLARRGDDLEGFATYRLDGEAAELAAIGVTDARRHGGVGGAMLDAVVAVARGAGARRLWLVTTNDNLDALRFYQRRGFHLAELHVDGVTRARALKPEIPDIGDYGIPMRDELVLRLPLA